MEKNRFERKGINKGQKNGMYGKVPWNKGLKGFGQGHIVSEKTRQKLRKANFGKEYSYETRKKLSMINTGEKEFTGFRKLINKRIRMMGKYLEWRSAVFKRDNYHCQNCGAKGYLEAHHIIAVSKIMSEFKIKTIDDARKCKELWDIGNGITYCKKCHLKLDKNIGISIENRRISQ